MGHRLAARVSGLVCAAGVSGPVAAQVEFRTDPLPAGAQPAAVVQERLGVAAKGSARVVVQLDRAVTDASRGALASAGLTLLAPLGDDAFFARVDGAVLDEKRLAAEGVRLVEPIRSAWKLHPDLQAGGAAVPGLVMERFRDGVREAAIPVCVLFHSDAPMGLDAVKVVGAHGGVVRSELLSLPAVVAEVPLAAVAALAGEDSVQWVEPALPMLTGLNDGSRALTQVDSLQAAPFGLSGAGATVLVYDGGRARITHRDFTGRIAQLDNSPLADHPTHVAGTVGGSGASSEGGVNRGMAPGVYLLTASLPRGSTTVGQLLYTDPGDIEADYAQAMSYPNHPADLATNSIGLNVTPNGLSCSLLGDYGVTDAVIDSVVRGSLGRPLPVTWAGGNERGVSRCWTAPGYASVSPPSGAKNHICVGAVNSNDDSMTDFSSWGPTDDGRLKPDVVAPGCQVGGDTGVTSCSGASDTAYRVACGTSMATPAVAGICALLLEDFRARFPGRDNPLPATFKALLAHSAEDLGRPGPDFQFGYGSVRARAAVELLRTGGLAEGAVVQGQAAPMEIVVQPGETELKVTLAWADAPAAPNIVPCLVNNLDLEVTDPSGQRWYPWTLNPVRPTDNAVRTQRDTRNNMEQVRVETPVAGTWRVKVVGTSVPVGPQAFSVAATPRLGAATVRFAFETPLPARVAAGTPTDVVLRVEGVNQSVIPGGVVLHHRSDAGDFAASSLTDLGEGRYRATLPAAACGTRPEFFFTAAGTVAGQTSAPFDAPKGLFRVDVGTLSVRADESFESDAGWTTSSVPNVPPNGPLAGFWERGVPVGDGLRGEPVGDADGSGSCFLTGNTAGDSDVDNGSVALISPRMDASGGTAVLRYYRWYNNTGGSSPGLDTFRVDVSADDGQTWVPVETIGPTGDHVVGGWKTKTVVLNELITPTGLTRVRFTASDVAPSSIIEAGVDGVRLTVFRCVNPPPACPCDPDEDGAATVEELFGYVAAWFGGNGDLTGDGEVDLRDLFRFLECFFAGCE